MKHGERLKKHMKNNKINIQLVCNIEMDADIIASILAAGSPKDSLNDYLSYNHNIIPDNGYNLGELKTNLGKYLAEEIISEVKQITV